MEGQSEPRLVTAKDGAFRVGVPLKTVHGWIKRNELWDLAPPGGTTRLYSLKRLRELAADYHARKRDRAAKKETRC